jgi:hypothetical protein
MPGAVPGATQQVAHHGEVATTMRIESSITALSWIPSEAIKGMTRLPFDMGMAHYDPPPPDVLDQDLDQLSREGRFRLANRLAAWIEVEDGRIVAHGQGGRGRLSSTEVKVGVVRTSFAPVALPELRPEPQVGEGFVRFVQSAGGRTGLAMPRRVNHPPFVQLMAPYAWTTLALTLHADGRVERELVGASPFPRHWVYDDEGRLCQKSGLVDFTHWARGAYWRETPWGDCESPAVVTEVESALERRLSRTIMGGLRPSIRELKVGQVLCRQGEPGDELYLLLDGVLAVEVDGAPLAELGPGVVLGERAVLEGGVRTSTLVATTPCRVAVAGAGQIDRAALAELAQGHRRELSGPGALLRSA